MQGMIECYLELCAGDLLLSAENSSSARLTQVQITKKRWGTIGRINQSD